MQALNEFTERRVHYRHSIARIILRLCPEQLQRCFINWMQQISKETKDKIVAIDGKILRHSYDKKKSLSTIHMVSAFAAENGVVLGQIKTAEKSNKITAIPELIDFLDIKDCIVAIDAMGCQEKISKKIITSNADYLLAVKGNQPTLHEEIVVFFDVTHGANFKGVNHDYYEENHKGHGRIETRRYWITDTLATISAPEKWMRLCSIGMVHSERYICHSAALLKEYFLFTLYDYRSCHA